MTIENSKMNKEKIVFSEHHVMALSLKNIWTKMASTYQCINVDLSEELLIVRPILLIGWLIVILGLDLYHEIPVGQIRAVEENGRWRDYGKVDITFINDKGDQRVLRLYLKKHLEFMGTLKPMIQ